VFRKSKYGGHTLTIEDAKKGGKKGGSKGGKASGALAAESGRIAEYRTTEHQQRAGRASQHAKGSHEGFLRVGCPRCFPEKEETQENLKQEEVNGDN